MSAHAAQAFSIVHCTDSEDLPPDHNPKGTPINVTKTGFRSISVDLRDPFAKLKLVLQNW